MRFSRYYVIMIRILNKFIIIIVLLISALNTFADDFTLKGKIVDENGNALELVTVSCLAQGKVAMSNLKGEFSIGLSTADSVEVRFTMVGYGVRKRVFRHPKGKMTVQIVMHPSATLKEVTVTQRRRQTSQTEQLNAKDIKDVPSTTGWSIQPQRAIITI